MSQALHDVNKLTEFFYAFHPVRGTSAERCGSIRSSRKLSQAMLCISAGNDA